jgi:hypothetical protein
VSKAPSTRSSSTATLGLTIGDPLDIDIDDHEKLAAAFLDEIVGKVPPK